MAKLYKLYLVARLLARVNWVRFYRLCRKDAADVLLLYPGSAYSVLRYLLDMETVIYDLAVIAWFIGAGRPFCLRFGAVTDGLRGRRVHVTLSRQLRPGSGADYTKGAFDLIRELEAAGNSVFPSLREALFWENKAHMYGKFRELGISHPETWIVRKGEPVPAVDFPVLFKEVHSAGSAGVFKVSSPAELAGHSARVFAAGHEAFILQRIVDMRADLRAIVVGGRVVLHYWRKNSAPEWRPTSTSRGSVVDFWSFPELWRGEIVAAVGRLGLRTGALDVTWEKDDTSTPPLFLEVSPVYQPNPEPPRKYRDLPYCDYKKKRFVSGSYFVKYIDAVFAIKKQLYDLYFPDAA